MILHGFGGKILHEFVQKFSDICVFCYRAKYIMSARSPLETILYKCRGPDDFIPHSLSRDPLSLIVLDEVGPFYIDYEGARCKVWCLLAVELITNKVHILPLQRQNAASLVAALEQLQAIRGRYSSIVLDKHSSHLMFGNQPNVAKVAAGVRYNKNSALRNLFRKKMQAHLGAAGITVVISAGGYHRQLG